VARLFELGELPVAHLHLFANLFSQALFDFRHEFLVFHDLMVGDTS
jgi:hypothetical protein